MLAIPHYNRSLNSGLIKDEYVYTKLIEIYWQAEQPDSIIEVSKIAIERFPFTPMFYYYQGVALSNKKEHESSINTLIKGKEFISETLITLVSIPFRLPVFIWFGQATLPFIMCAVKESPPVNTVVILPLLSVLMRQ